MVSRNKPHAYYLFQHDYTLYTSYVFITMLRAEGNKRENKPAFKGFSMGEQQVKTKCKLYGFAELGIRENLTWAQRANKKYNKDGG